MSNHHQTKKRIWQLIAFFVVGLLVITREAIVGALSPRAMAMAAVILAAAGWFFLTITLRRDKDQQPKYPIGEKAISAEQKKIRRSVIALQIWLLLMIFALINGLWSTRGNAIPPRLVGVAVNLAIIWAIVISIRRQKTRINGLALTPTPPLPGAGAKIQ